MAQDGPPPQDRAAEPKEEEEAPATNPFLKDLQILPPLQSFGGDDNGVPLPPIRAEEPVSSLRAALSEVRGYAHLTNYRFVLEKAKVRKTEVAPEASIGSEPSQVVSPYTGPDAVVSAASSVKGLGKEPSDVSAKEAEVVLDDYGDLQPLLEKGLEDGAAFRIVLERYDPATVRDHVTRLRSLFDGNAPSVVSLADDAASSVGQEEGGAEEEVKEETVKDEKEDSIKEEPGDDKEAKLREAAKKTHDAATAEKLPTFPFEKSIAVDGSNLRDFFYLTCGEEEELWENANGSQQGTAEDSTEKKSKKKKNKGKKGDTSKKDSTVDESSDKESSPADSKNSREICRRLNELEEKTKVKCTIRYSGFHPPPPSRRLIGDLAYLEVTTPGYPNEPVLHITAIPTGFYVNKTKLVDSAFQFDPSPAEMPCFSHELLDCLLKKSKSLRTAWADALSASKERAIMSATMNDTPLQSLHRVATRGDAGGCGPSALHPGVDSVVLRPSWLMPLPKSVEWSHNSLHEYNPTKAEADLSDMFGLDLRSAALRDWNEELQSAREMPKSDLNERIDRARMIHKVLTEFGEAAVVGARAIFDGHVAPMNPNEPTRSHVYLHNNIFFSRAVDAGVETFKITKGDRAARKSASRDAHCMGALHRLDIAGLYSLATVLVDYLGTRFVCQSIVPGILHGEKTHTLLYGAVEATAPLAWDKEMHQLLEDSLGKALMIATRTVPKMPLSDERMEVIEELRITPALMPEKESEDVADDKTQTNQVCGPIEAKGIRGSDQRSYVLDLSRLTPRDANWVPKSKGGSGKWETVLEESNNGKRKLIPDTLDDDEWTMAVLRQECVTSWTHKKMAQYLEKKQESEKAEKEKSDSAEKEESESGSGDKSDDKDSAVSESKDEKQEMETNDDKKDEESTKPTKKKLSPEDEEYLQSLRLNLNVFLPNLRSLAGIDDAAVARLKADQEMTCEISKYLWDELLPKVTKEIREGGGHQVPMDGKNLSDMLHQRGVNCRYMGRLAMLAVREEEKDQEDLRKGVSGEAKQTPRRAMPLSWLDLLECEMVARAAKHVLESYLNENGGAAAMQPAQTIASFLSALMSEGEETAGETETRIAKEVKSNADAPDEDDFNALAMCDTGGKGDAVPPPVRGRTQVWEDIQREVGRRFRYNLTLYNTSGSSGRALYIPLLRRVCQRTGVRLVAKNYSVGGKCLCSGGNNAGGRITPSYPISPIDILDVVPLVKHAAAQGGEGFVPYHSGASVGPPSLHILLPDAKATFEAAHLHYSARALPQALDLAQEAAGLYQRVTDTPLHSNVARCLDLTSAILFEANEPQLAAANAARALGLVVQLGGFDCPEALTAHSSLSHIMMSSGAVAGGVKHLRAAMYLMELMSGPRYPELSNAYHKLASLYHEAGDGISALRFYQEASARHSSDRLVEGMIAKGTALVLAALGQFKPAVDSEKRAYRIFSLLVGEEHDLTKSSASTLNKLLQLSVDQGTRQVAEDKKRAEQEAADAIASQIEADEAEEEKKKKKGKKKKKKT